MTVVFPALRRQSNPNWLAMIYRIDNKPTHGEIADLVSSFDDPRLEFDETETNPVGSQVLFECYFCFHCAFLIQSHTFFCTVFAAGCRIHNNGQVLKARAAAARVPVDLRHYLG